MVLDTGSRCDDPYGEERGGKMKEKLQPHVLIGIFNFNFLGSFSHQPKLLALNLSLSSAFLVAQNLPFHDKLGEIFV